MLADVLPYLRCPLCRTPLGFAAGGGSVHCPAGHCFDLARHGYLHLAGRPVRHPGDTTAMVAARAGFLATGAYDFLAAALAGAVAGDGGGDGDGDAGGGGSGDREGGGHGGTGGHPQLIVDVGAGTGYYLARVLDARPGAVGLAVDVAKPALRRAARAHPRLGAVLADAWRGLPVADHVATAVLNVFAPRNPAEFARVLSRHGSLLVATPTPAHLAELSQRLGTTDGVRVLGIEPEKPAQLAAGLAKWFRPAGEVVHTTPLSLPGRAVRALVEMGPSGAHTDPAALARAVAELPEPVSVTASVRLSRFRPR